MKNFQGPKEGEKILFRDEAKKIHIRVVIFSSWFLSWNDVFSDQAQGGKSENKHRKVRISGFFHPKEYPIYK